MFDENKQEPSLYENTRYYIPIKGMVDVGTCDVTGEYCKKPDCRVCLVTIRYGGRK